jgi:hypothetical protein
MAAACKDRLFLCSIRETIKAFMSRTRVEAECGRSNEDNIFTANSITSFEPSIPDHNLVSFSRELKVNERVEFNYVVLMWV